MTLTHKLRTLLATARRDERGMSEAATAILVLPLIAALVFLLVEVGFNMQTRTLVDRVVADTVRSAALDGGPQSQRTSHPSIYRSGGWDAVGTRTLQKNCSDGLIRTSTPCAQLRITCVVENGKRAADVPGQLVTCRTNDVVYDTVSPMSSSPLFSFGMSGLFSQPINAKATAAAAVGLEG